MVLFNFSNLHHGGGVQVAVSFFNHLIKFPPPHDYIVLASSEILENIDYIPHNFKYQELNTYGLMNNYFSFKQHSPSLIFTLFGPIYYCPKSIVSVVGFAQPNIVYRELAIKLGLKYNLKKTLKFYLQKLAFICFSDLVITEVDDVTERISHYAGRIKNVKTIANQLNDALISEDKESNSTNQSINNVIGVIGADYEHKNWATVFKIAYQYLDINLDIKFNITLTIDQAKNYVNDIPSNVSCQGRLKLKELPNFYKSCSIIWCPSLLECFSATPLEALYFNKKLILPNLPFNKAYTKCAFTYEVSCNQDLLQTINYALHASNKDVPATLFEAKRSQQYIEALNSLIYLK